MKPKAKLVTESCAKVAAELHNSRCHKQVSYIELHVYFPKPWLFDYT